MSIFEPAVSPWPSRMLSILRIVAGVVFVSFGTMNPKSVFPTINQGTPAILYCFLFLYLTVAGAGVWSIDAVIARSKRRA
jgi:uncharacterized membrane protein YphA (DoxX/SURF4 family)